MCISTSNTERSDIELMAAVGRGQMDALGELVRRHERQVRAVAYRLTGRWDVADDIAQETFLRVLRASPTYKPSASVTTWLYRIVVNLCLDLKRRRRPLQLAKDDDLGCAAAPAADEQMEKCEAARAVQREVTALPERERIAVVLHRFEGLNHARIAEVTGWTEPAIESLLVRAYGHLRERLREWAEV